MQHAGKKGPTLIPLAAARANAFATDWARYAPPVPTSLGRRELRNVDLARDRALHRLGAVLPGLGAVGPVSRDPRRPGRRRGGAQRARRRPGDAEARSSRAAGSPRTASSGCWPRERASATTSRSTPTRRARSVAADLAQPAPAEREARRASRTYCLADFVAPKDSGVRGLPRRVRGHRGPRHREASSRSSRRRTTTTTRSC